MNVIGWLVDADPAIRWQVMCDVTHDPSDAISAERLAEAVEVVERKRDPEGRWSLENVQEGASHFEMEREGEPSRWNTASRHARANLAS